MVKGIILDIDGVIVGEKIGFNSPHPHANVLQKMKTVRDKGIPIILCTAKPHFAISDIIQGAQLHNPHITDAGAVIIDPIDKRIVEEHLIPKHLVSEIIELCLRHNIYVECYTTQHYYIQKSLESEITKKHTHILQSKPTVVELLPESADKHNITKIMPIALNVQDKEKVHKLFQPFSQLFSISWGVHPIALPLQFGIITAKGCSKKEAAEGIIKNMRIPFGEILGIGDSTSDWQFIQLCGYGATVANGSDELKNFIKTKGQSHSIIGPSVDENGLIPIFEYFKL